MQSSGQIIFNEPDKKPDNTNPNNSAQDATKDNIDDLEEKDPAEAAKLETEKETIKREVVSKQKIDDLTQKLSTVLFQTTTVFPFELFPVNLIIRPTKIDIVNTQFFWSDEIHTTMIKDITDVTIHTSLFFAALTITDQGYHDKLISVRFLKKGDALKARRIIQGLIIAIGENIDPEKIEPNQLIEKVEELGRSAES